MVKNAIKVYVRLKPEKNPKNVVNYQIHRRPKGNLEEDFLILITPQKIKEYLDHRPESWNFSFFRIFEENATQSDIFETVAKPVVNSVLDGFNGTIFAYGQTGSGKTYTVTGDQKKYDARGIIPRSLQYLFEVVQKHPENVYSVEVAYLEIYNECGYDLLERRQRRELAVTRLEDLPRVTIQEDDNGVLHLKNLTFHCIENEQDAFELLLVGDSNRITADTPMNPQSSRSHCIFTVVVSTKRFGADCYKRAKMHLVDLAGSERVYKCAITGTILTEAKHINLSLHYLEQVIVCLGQESGGHIPYRNSLLTSILRDSLGGNCLTTMIATLSVSSFNFEETISTCRFSQRVALIKNDVNLVLEKDINSENTLLRLENERLKQKIEAMTKQNVTSVKIETPRELTAEEKRTLESQINRFLKSNTTICWDNNPNKIQHCFETFKKYLLLSKDANSWLEKLDYYKNMVIQRDKEISLLINMLKKERSKKSDTATEERVEDNPHSSRRKFVSSNHLGEVTSNVESEEHNLHRLQFVEDSGQGGQSESFAEKNSVDIKIPLRDVLENGDTKLDLLKSLNVDKNSGRNSACFSATSKSSVSNAFHQSQTGVNIQAEKSDQLCKNDCSDAHKDIWANNNIKNRKEPCEIANKKRGCYLKNSAQLSSSCPLNFNSLKPSATCNIVNMTLCDLSKPDVEIKEGKLTNKSNRSVQKNEETQLKSEKNQHPLKKAADIKSGIKNYYTDEKEEDKMSGTQKISKQFIETKSASKENLTKWKIEENSPETPSYFQRFVQFNVPRNAIEPLQIINPKTRQSASASKLNEELQNNRNTDFTSKSPKYIKNMKRDDEINRNLSSAENSEFSIDFPRNESQLNNKKNRVESEEYNKTRVFLKNTNNRNKYQGDKNESQFLNVIPTDAYRILHEDASIEENLNESFINDGRKSMKDLRHTKAFPGIENREGNEARNENGLPASSTNFPVEKVNKMGEKNGTDITFQRNTNPRSIAEADDLDYIKQINNSYREEIHQIQNYHQEQSFDRDEFLQKVCSSGDTKNTERFLFQKVECHESRILEKSLPLTGDPEIDEEIIAFYKAKRSGGTY